ncbi:hypothetical protein [Okeania sp.]|uniref:hypothetical protein n=1 Tax=Okeania sp. TaxID=3100323 RepID=UPI002B4AF10C|nr:hypothetical protein [Okeania sp.]MEB3339273.1 hypothetical protein [Okeania sp.]
MNNYPLSDEEKLSIKENFPDKLNNYPLSDKKRLSIKKISQTSRNISKTNNNNKMDTQDGKNNSQGPNQVYSFISLLSVCVVIIAVISQSWNRFRIPPICNYLLTEVKSKIASVASEEQLEIINKFIQDKIQNEQCPSSDEVYGEFYELFYQHGQEKVKNTKFKEAIQTWCSVTGNYGKITEEITKLISPNSGLLKAEKRKLINEIFKQNQSENKCPSYSLDDQQNKKYLFQQLEQINKFYDKKAKSQSSEYYYQEAVRSYCQISNHYSQLPQIKLRLEDWYKDEFEVLILREQREEIINTLNKIGKNNCPAFPDI